MCLAKGPIDSGSGCIREMNCDVKPHVRSESVVVEIGLIGRWRGSGSVSGPVPAVACVVGDDRVRSPRKSLRGPAPSGGHRRGEDWHGVTERKSLLMPRNAECPGRVVAPGMQGLCCCEAAGGDRGFITVVWTPWSPGYRGHPTPVVSHACRTWKSLQGPVIQWMAGKFTARKAQSPGGERMPKKLMPAGRKATGNHRCHTRPPREK